MVGKIASFKTILGNVFKLNTLEEDIFSKTLSNMHLFSCTFYILLYKCSSFGVHNLKLLYYPAFFFVCLFYKKHKSVMIIRSRWGCFYKNEEAWLSLIASKKNIFNICGEKKEKIGQSFQWDTSSWGRMPSSFLGSSCLLFLSVRWQTSPLLPSWRWLLALKASITHHANSQS